MTAQPQPIYGKNILSAVERCPIIMKKLSLFSTPLELRPLGGALQNLQHFARAFGKEEAVPRRIIISASEAGHKIDSLDPWMQQRIRESGWLPFRNTLYDPLVRLVLEKMVARHRTFPATDIHLDPRHESDEYHCASETLCGVQAAITDVWGLQNQKVDFVEGPWVNIIEAEAKKRESPRYLCDEMPAVTYNQALGAVRIELATDPFKRMELGIVHAVGLENPALNLFAWRAAESCRTIFSAWATLLISSGGIMGCEYFYGLFEMLIDDYAAGNFLVGIDEFTLLIA